MQVNEDRIMLEVGIDMDAVGKTHALEIQKLTDNFDKEKLALFGKVSALYYRKGLSRGLKMSGHADDFLESEVKE